VPHISDFLWTSVALTDFMRLSVKKAAQATLYRAAYRKSGHLDFEMWVTTNLDVLFQGPGNLDGTMPRTAI
jgi:hypothetical protein